MDWILRTVHKRLLGSTLGSEVFTVVDDVAPLAEMLQVLLLVVDMNDEATVIPVMVFKLQLLDFLFLVSYNYS